MPNAPAMEWSPWLISEVDYPITPQGNLFMRSNSGDVTGPLTYDQSFMQQAWDLARTGSGDSLDKLNVGTAAGALAGSRLGYDADAGAGTRDYFANHYQSLALYHMPDLHDFLPGSDTYQLIDNVIATALESLIEEFDLVEGINYDTPPGGGDFYHVKENDDFLIANGGKIRIIDEGVFSGFFELRKITNFYFLPGPQGLGSTNADEVADSVNWQFGPSPAFAIIYANEMWSWVTNGSTVFTNKYETKEVDASVNTVFPSTVSAGEKYGSIRVMTGFTLSEDSAAVGLPGSLSFGGVESYTHGFTPIVVLRIRTPRWRYWGHDFPLRRLQNGVIDSLLRQLYNNPWLSLRITSRWY